MIRFATPLALLLLLLLPAAAALGWPRPGPGRARERLSLTLRLLILILLIFSLAGLELVRSVDELAVVFLIDASDSMTDEAQEAAYEYARSAIEEMGVNDQAAVILFGGDALVERPMSSSPTLGPLTSIPRTSSTDLAEAIRLAMALFPQQVAKRMVILSDGADTVGEAQEAARLAGASGVEIWTAALTGEHGPETALVEVTLPPRLHEGENFQLQLTIASNQGGRSEVRVFAGNRLIYEGELDLRPGEERYSLPLTAGEAGIYTYQVQIDPEEDSFYQNNELEAFTQVEGPPLVLLVVPPEGEELASGEIRGDEGLQLRQALEAVGIEVETAEPGELSPDPANLINYAEIILVDVPARSLSQRQMEALQLYVRELGGGLTAVGGPTSYGVGGYFRTPLEEILPVEMQIKDPLRRPTVTMVFIIDHSGSMTSGMDGISKLELAKEAAIRSIDLLFPTDRVGVVAFDDSAQWVVPITELDNPDGIKNAIASLRSGGGTDILAGLWAAARELPEDPGQVKHIILLTDGGANPAGIPELVSSLNRDHGVTLTSVGVGQDAAPFLPELARLGGGRYHFTVDPGTIPSIFTEETSLASRSYIIEESFYPQLAAPSPILAGISETPPLHGYVGTSAKASARTILVSPQEDPLLAAWQYGLGRAVAFTSDATGRWARDWVAWPGFTTFWSQAVRYALRQPASEALQTEVQLEGEAARIVVEAQTAAGEFLNHYDLQARLITPDGATETLSLKQTASGRYEAEFTPEGPGVYLIGLSGAAEGGEEGGESGPVASTSGWVLSYSPEYRELEGDPQALARLMSAANGRPAADKPAEVFRHDFQATRSRRPVWPWLLATAAILLPLDIAVRRLLVTPAEIWRGIVRGGETLRARLRREALVEGPTPQRSERIEALIQARKRLRPQERTQKQEAARAEKEARRAEAVGEKRSAPRPQSRETEKPLTREPGSEEAASTAARLLAKKRSKHQD